MNQLYCTLALTASHQEAPKPYTLCFKSDLFARSYIHLTSMHCPISKDHTQVLIGSTDRLNRQVPILHMYNFNNLSHQVNLLRSSTAHMAVSGWWVADDPCTAGTVEMCIHNVWGSICDHGWNRASANVACRQLGYFPSGMFLLVRTINAAKL